LRRKIGYRGLVGTDDMEMQGVLAAAPMEEAAVRAIAAGADVLLICHQEDLIVRAYEAVVHASESDSSFAELVHRATARVLAFKRKHRKLGKFPPPPKPTDLNRLVAQLQEFSAHVEASTLTIP
jgi:beta-N-acetylhexosaminidase